METIFYYILRTIIATAVLYLFFKLFLSKNRQHKINRFVILFFFISSLILPFFSLDISGLFPQKPKPTFNLQNINIAENVQTAQTTQPHIIIPWNKIIAGIYIIGAIILLTVFTISLLRIFHIIKTSQRNKLNDKIKLCISNKDISPFSWMNYLVLSKEDYAEKDNSIIEHEMAHIFYHHSIDMMIANIYLIIFWFNPFAWLLRKELQTIHEYQADEKVISAGADIKEYQLLLIRKCVGENKFMLANNFEYSNLQKRIKMIMNTQTKKTKKWTYAIIPLLLIVISATLSAKELHSKSEVFNKSINQLDDSVKREIIAITRGDTTYVTETSNGVVKKSKIAGKYLADTINGKSTMVFKTIDEDGAKITVKVTPKDSVFSKGKPLVLVDGKKVDFDKLNEINPNDIELMNVLKDESATSTYGDEGKNGVILVTTKAGIRMSVASTDDNGNETTYVKATNEGQLNTKGLEDVAIFINGKLSKPEQLKALNPNKIKSMGISKKPDSKLAKKYKTDKDTVIEVLTK